MPATQTRVRKTGAAARPAKAKVAATKRSKLAPVASTAAPSLSTDERQRMIAQAAYFRAEKRGFAPGGEWQDWFEAEAELARLIETVRSV